MLSSHNSKKMNLTALFSWSLFASMTWNSQLKKKKIIANDWVDNILWDIENMKLLLIVESIYDFLTLWYIFYIYTGQKNVPQKHVLRRLVSNWGGVLPKKDWR